MQVDMPLVNTVLNGVLLIVGVPLLWKLVNRVEDFSRRFERLEVAVLGADGKGGLNGEFQRFRDWKHDSFVPWANRIGERLAVVEEKTGTREEP